MVDTNGQERAGRLDRIFDVIPVERLLREAEDEVGTKRMGELVWWAVLWGLTGETSGSALRRRLEEEGLTERSAYRAAADYKRIGDRLLRTFGDDVGPGSPDVPGILRKLAAVKAG